MSELSSAELIQATALALLRHSVVDGGAGVPVTAMTSTAYTPRNGRLEVTYARRAEPAVFEYAEEEGTVCYTCLANRARILLEPAMPIYEQIETGESHDQ